MKPSPLRRGFKKDSERQSIEIRQKLGLSSRDACPARRVAELYGVSVSPAQCLTNLLETELRDEFPDLLTVKGQMTWLLSPDCDFLFSAVVVIVRGYKMILYNADHSPARQESSIMHELSHVICEHPGDCLQVNADIALRQYNPQYEEEAKWLGATLQIPDEGLFPMARAGHSQQAIAEHFGASLEMVTYRWQTLGIDIRLARLQKFRRY